MLPNKNSSNRSSHTTCKVAKTIDRSSGYQGSSAVHEILQGSGFPRKHRPTANALQRPHGICGSAG